MGVFFNILYIIGSLGLFLFGMTLMSSALQKLAGYRLRSFLMPMTSSPFRRILTGTVFTGIIQSSSATTVMTVSLVNAGLLTLVQAIGVIMGANIGTTVTAWIVSFFGFTIEISSVSLPLIAFGFALMMLRKDRYRSVGEMVIGFSLLFLGLTYLKDAFPDLEDMPALLSFMAKWTDWGFLSVLVFVLAGMVITALLQSSSATMTLTLVLCCIGYIPFEMAAAMVLGENIGTTVTANIAASVANVSAKRAALSHTLFNVIGVIWALVLFRPFLWAVSELVVLFGGEDPAVSTASATYALSAVHTLFNVANTLLLVWFTPQLASLATVLIKDRKHKEVYRLKYLRSGLTDTAELSLEQAKLEIVHFAELVRKQFGYARQAVYDADDEAKFKEVYMKLEHYEQITDRVELEIAKYLGGIREGYLSREGTRAQRAMYKIIGELESLGDAGFNIARILNRKNIHGQKFDYGMVLKIDRMLGLVLAAIDCMTANLKASDTASVDIVAARRAEMEINEYRDTLKEENLRSIESEESSYLLGVYYMDLIAELERAGDYIINVSEAMMEKID